MATWAISLASGFAQLLLAAGTKGKRYALPHVKILLKGAWGPANGTAKAQEQLAYTAKLMIDLIAKETGQSIQQVRTDAERMRWFTAREAIEYGLIDDVRNGLGFGS